MGQLALTACLDDWVGGINSTSMTEHTEPLSVNRKRNNEAKICAVLIVRRICINVTVVGVKLPQT